MNPIKIGKLFSSNDNCNVNVYFDMVFHQLLTTSAQSPSIEFFFSTFELVHSKLCNRDRNRSATKRAFIYKSLNAITN